MNMVAGGEQSGYGILTVREQLWMFTQFYGLEAREGWRRVDELIEAVDMQDQRLQRVSTLSTGQRQKMNMARGLLNDPWILFLDEPTLGPRRRRRARHPRPGARVEGRGPGADGAADDPLHAGGRRAVRADRDRRPRPDPRHRHARRAQEARPERVDLPARGGPPRRRRPAPSRGCRASCRRARRGVDPEAQRVAVNLVLEEDAALGAVVTALGGLGSQILALRKSEPTLEDVFVELVGRGFSEEAERVAVEA